MIHIPTRRTPPRERLTRLREPRIHATSPSVLAASAPPRLAPGCLWNRSRIGGDAIQYREQLVTLLLERSDDTREAPFAFTRQANPRSPSILIAGLADDETSFFGPTNGTCDRVRLHAQPFGDVGDGGALVAGRGTLDHQKQQVPLRCQAGSARGCLSRTLERPQGRAEAGDRDIVGRLFKSSHYEINRSYYEVISQ